MSIGCDVLVFDIDGVLIDVSESYRNATRRTVQLYLEACLGLPPCDGDLVSHEDVAAFKLVGGFNNDWDLTTAILKYFLTWLDPQPVAHHLPPETNSAEVMRFLREAGTHIDTTVEAMRQQKDILSFTRMLKTVGGGLDAVWKVLGEQNDHLLFARGNLRHTHLVQRIFQELYLGEAYFSREYGEAPLIYNGPGLIQQERLIVSPQVLTELGKRVSLGIATGRPRNEAIYALETANVLNRFRSLVALEDKEQAEGLQEANRNSSLHSIFLGPGIEGSIPRLFHRATLLRQVTAEWSAQRASPRVVQCSGLVSFHSAPIILDSAPILRGSEANRHHCFLHCCVKIVHSGGEAACPRFLRLATDLTRGESGAEDSTSGAENNDCSRE